jgi:hypothetical protein
MARRSAIDFPSILLSQEGAMANDNTWYSFTSDDPGIAGNAFAAAGVLSAHRWNYRIQSLPETLRDLVKDRHQTPMEWRYPSQRSVSSGRVISDQELSDAWQQAFSKYTIQQRKAVRLLVRRIGPRALHGGYADASRTLAALRLGGGSGYVDSVSFALLRSATRHDWAWPLRFNRIEVPSFSGRLTEILGRSLKREVSESRDVTVITDPSEAAMRRLLNNQPGLAIVSAPASDASRLALFERWTERSTAPVAFVDVPPDLMQRFEHELENEISHNKHLDLALFDASQSLGVQPPLLFTPNIGPETLLEDPRIENRVKEMRDRLANLPGNMPLGRIPGAPALGIRSDAQTVAEYLTDIDQAIDESRLDFDRESNGGLALQQLGEQVSGLETSARSSALDQPDSPQLPDLQEHRNLGVAGDKDRAPGAIAVLNDDSSGSEPAPESTAGSAIGTGETELAATSAAAAVSSLDTRPFTAYPRISAPKEILSDSFQFEVGFSKEPDRQAALQTEISVVDPRPGEDMLVLVAAKGARIVGTNSARLELTLSAAAQFTAAPATGVQSVEISAEYFFRNEHVGTVVKEIALKGNQPVSLPMITQDLYAPMLLAINRHALDLILIVKLEEPDYLTFQAINCRSNDYSPLIRTHTGNTRQHATKLDRDQRPFSHCGAAGHMTVKGVAQSIADAIPIEIMDSYIKPMLTGEGPPEILILTNEPYIPWELALVQTSGAPTYLGAVARVGRWWVGARMAPPPLEIEVRSITAVGADKYGLDSNQKDLQHAKEEREWLCSQFSAKPVVANRLEVVMEWIDALPTGPGHLAHLALHGYSDPGASEQALIMGDGKPLPPILLAGIRDVHQEPRFSMVFLNACQVGSATECLGQIAGFPGALLTAGTGGVIGPIWEVNDIAARGLAQDFYKIALRQGVPVSETLRQFRANCSTAGSTTPLAYIFYGHPSLRLNTVPN